MDNFIYDVPTKIYFGKGEENNVAKYIKEFHPNKVLIHYGGKSAIKSGLIDKVCSLLEKENIAYIKLGGVSPNPTLPLVREGISLGLKENVDFILAIGGGSVLDSAKDIANGLANINDDVWDYSLGKKSPLKAINKGAILTLAAAGSEMSNSCVITNPETHEKRGYNNPNNHFNFAIENPELTFTVSKYQTACGAVDIAMHTIERYFGIGENTPLTDSLAEAVIKNAFTEGKICYDEPENYEARANMMWASSLAHNGLTGCGRQFLMVVHQFEHELSGLYPEIAHGAGLAALWCSWARYVYKANIDRWAKYAANVWDEKIIPGQEEKAIISAINKQENYYKSINMPVSLQELNVKEEDLNEFALRCSRNKTRILKGYKDLGYEEILDIYKLAYQKH